MSKVILEPNYYLTNFLSLIEFVHSRYNNVMPKEAKAFYFGFHGLSNDAKKLLVRCLMRKGEYFRTDKLKYAEIDDTHSAAEELLSSGFASKKNCNESLEWLELLTKPELCALNKDETSWKKLKRDALEDAVIEWWTCQDDIDVLAALFVIEVKTDIFDCFRLLFFGNNHQDLTDFVLQDLGLTQFEQYAISQTHLPFQSLEQVEAHRKSIQIMVEIDAIVDWTVEDIQRLLIELPSYEADDLFLKRRCGKICLVLAKELERLNAYEQAYDVYDRTDLLPSNERQIRLLDKLGQFDLAYQHCSELEMHTTSEEEKQFCQFFLGKLSKKLNKIFHRKPVYTPQEILITLEQTELTVEQSVVAFLSEPTCQLSGLQKGEAFWLENHLVCGLFALIYWDVLFADVNGAFFHPFQQSPADLYVDDFIHSRYEQISALHTMTLNDSDLMRWLRTQYDKHYGKTCTFIDWQLFDELLLNRVLQHISADHIRLMTHRILEDRKENRSGMTDLVHFVGDNGYELIEVKGPGDRLQKNQLRWMAFYKENNIPHKVIRVEWL